VILEAGVLSTPVVASRVGGIPEIVHDGDSGVLVPPDDARTLADALDRLLVDRERATEQAGRLRDDVRRNFALVTQIRAYQDVFETSRKPKKVGLAHNAEE
jgi:glycosyltransferase involved in cell wall biosynthesis